MEPLLEPLLHQKKSSLDKCPPFDIKKHKKYLQRTPKKGKEKEKKYQFSFANITPNTLTQVISTKKFSRRNKQINHTKTSKSVH